MHIFIIAATSIDGFLADKVDQNSTSWTSPEDFKYFSKRTKEAGVIVMGSNTYQTIGHPLKDRITIVMTNHPESIPDSKDISEIGNCLPAVEAGKLEIGHSLFTTSMTPQELAAFLADKGYHELAVCGGSSVYTQWMQSGLVQTILQTVEPYIFGSGISLFNQSLHQSLSLVSTTKLNDHTILNEYRVN